MSSTTYTASKTRDQGRNRFAAMFRHPVRLDPSTGRPGRRVRRGLGTDQDVEADRLISELNQLLADPAFWTLAARTTAEGRVDPLVVSMFYDGMEPSDATSSLTERDRLLPLPPTEAGVKKVLLLGTTGSGKTTLVRQLIGTDPEEERFPSTSTAKTTIADTEIILTDAPTYRAVVTFFGRDEIIDHLTDCASKAALATLSGSTASEIRRLLLDHEDQRFRFSYVLGRGAADASDGAEDDLDDFAEFNQPEDVVESAGTEGGEEFEADPEQLLGIDLVQTISLIEQSIATLTELVKEHEALAQAELGSGDGEERIVRELLEEELDDHLRSDERFNRVVDALLEEIEKRFDAVGDGNILRNQQGWPKAWTHESDDRLAFLKAVNRFSSNYARRFGQLLSPLVDGVRVAGPFAPKWHDQATLKLVLIDGEGLGHTPKSVAVLPTIVAKAVDAADAVLLVDNAAQPMQAAPAMAIRSILTSGNIEKLVFAFTHFDEVKGDNLRTASDRGRHVLASAENLISSFREEYNLRAEREVRRQLDHARFFLGNIDEDLDPAEPAQGQTIGQLHKLVAALERVGDRPEPGPSRPGYDKSNLVLAISAAVRTFHRRWEARLGFLYEADVDTEHWTRIKALNRRFAEGTADQYDTLRPSAELRELLKDEIYRTLEAPLSWTGEKPADDAEVDAIINAFAKAIATRLFDPICERLSVEPLQTWQAAYQLHGAGSTKVRARRISSDILHPSGADPGSDAEPGPEPVPAHHHRCGRGCGRERRSGVRVRQEHWRLTPAVARAAGTTVAGQA